MDAWILYQATVRRPSAVRKCCRTRLAGNNALSTVAIAVLWHFNVAIALVVAASAFLVVIIYQVAMSGGVDETKASIAVGIGGLVVGIATAIIAKIQENKVTAAVKAAAQRQEENSSQIIAAIHKLSQQQEETSSQIVTAINDMADRIEAALKTRDANR